MKTASMSDNNSRYHTGFAQGARQGANPFEFRQLLDECN